MRWTAGPSSKRRRRARAARLALAFGVALVVAAAAFAADDADRIDSLRRDLEAIRGKERTVLGELERLDAELRLRRAEVDSVEARLGTASAAVDSAASQLASLQAKQADRRRYLRFRLREIYKRGPGAPLRLLAGEENRGEVLRAARYAAYLGQKDVETLAAFRTDEERLAEETRALLEARRGIEADREAAQAARQALSASRRERSRYLAELRADRTRTEEALREIEGASRGLGDLAGSVGVLRLPEGREIEALRGTLDWPVSGKVRAGFGSTVHPQFKTAVPHPGLDIEAAEGTNIAAVTDGTVAFSGSLRGYGLTAIVDHGGGLLSVYAHAAVLLVEAGETVRRGDLLGKVGETGSLKGPYLYFELRKDGKPIDPGPWLRRR